MEINKQNQQAGDNSNLQQADVINNYTILFDEGKCREVCKSYFDMAQQNIAFAMDLAQKREMAFEDAVVNRLQKVENSMEAFGDPAFLKSLSKSQQAAICTDNKSDYDLLSELLVKRFEVGNDKQRSLYVNKAIELVDEMPEETLLGITIFHVFSQMTFGHPRISLLRCMISHLYELIIGDSSLPSNTRWIDDLEMMSVARVNKLSSFKKANEIMLQMYETRLQTGIKRGSETYNRAMEILRGCGFGETAFCENPLIKDYVYLQLDKWPDGYMLSIPAGENVDYACLLKDEQLTNILQIFKMYDESSQSKELAKEGFVKYMREDETIRGVMDWWDALPHAFELNPVASMLANVNARRLDASLPVLKI